MRILYIEDDPISIHAMRRVTQSLKYELLAAETAAEGKRLLIESPDLILLDINLPDADGLLLIRELRTEGFLTPIVALSAGILDSNKNLYLDAGCTDCVGKPVTFNQMCHYLRQYETR